MAHFSKFRETINHVVMIHPLAISKGFGFVIFTERDSVGKCFNADPHFTDDVEVNVKKTSKPTSGKDGDDHGNCEIIVLFPIGTKIDKEMFYMYFSQFGIVVSCTTPLNKVLNGPKNLCFVRL